MIRSSVRLALVACALVASLPAIEQAQYPENYAADLQQKIDLDFNYMTHRAEGKGNSPTNLIEQLVTAGPYTNKGSTKPEAD